MYLSMYAKICYELLSSVHQKRDSISVHTATGISRNLWLKLVKENYNIISYLSVQNAKDSIFVRGTHFNALKLIKASQI